MTFSTSLDKGAVAVAVAGAVDAASCEVPFMSALAPKSVSLGRSEDMIAN